MSTDFLFKLITLSKEMYHECKLPFQTNRNIGDHLFKLITVKERITSANFLFKPNINVHVIRHYGYRASFSD